LGEDETKTLLRFVEDRTVHLVRDEIAKGLATKDDIAAVKDDIVNLEKAVRADIAAMRQENRDVEWRTRLYVVAVAALIVATNPRILDLLTRLVGLAP